MTISLVRVKYTPAKSSPERLTSRPSLIANVDLFKYVEIRGDPNVVGTEFLEIRPEYLIIHHAIKQGSSGYEV